MRSIFVVSPFDGGWSVRTSSAGEPMVFDTGGQAERRARALASEVRARGGEAEVWIHDRTGRFVGRWIGDRHEIIGEPGEAVAA
ncbi:DUF2188 domain-containing protein [Caulobacter segnis]|uniref:DUF2188 domain-containing protein n=1 Tax=Caulobacter segnis TaxID=88688 RepID=UPI0028578F8D|nr:DUF2188 domain-containing protein [Caulobacter segnis]MDR6624054.1 hypothetical protein [Caulobacter segnis]